MKYEIDTIPVWDALKADTECSLCLLERRSRNAALRYFLGPSVMVPEVRVEVNRVGFSPEHLRLLAKDPNKLGLGLLTHTRLKTLRETIAERTKTLRAEAEKAASKGAMENLVSSKAGLKKAIDDFLAYLETESMQCLIQKKIDEDLERFSYTILHLWQKDADFQKSWSSGKGVCLNHEKNLLEMASQQFDAKNLGRFIQELLALQEKNLSRVELDILSFTQTFDATKSHEIQGQVAGALERSLQKIAGSFKEYEEESKTRRGPLMGM